MSRRTVGRRPAAGPHLRVHVRVPALLAILLLPSLPLPLRAQYAEVPRTRTFPGIPSPAFPYAQPEEVGLSGDKLDRLGDEITTWLAHGDFVGGGLLIVKA